MNMIRGLIFDMDGTLLDTIEDIAIALNRALLDMGLTGHNLEECKTLVGSGIENLAKAALPPDRQNEATIEELVLRFRAHYAQNWHDSTQPYEGIESLLNTLVKRGLHMAILSNKSHGFTSLMADHWFIRDGHQIFDPVWGERSGVPIKPDPSSSLAIAELWGLKPSEIAFIGDSEADMLTAVNAGMLAIGVAWGFRNVSQLLASGAKIILQSPEELLKYM